jgi:uncharacterized protein YdhG (YjbR/CyaY superfamily)
MGAVDEFLAGLDPATRAAFRSIIDLTLELAPEAEQGTSYGMPALRLRQKPLLGFRVAKQHLSVFPFSSQAVEAARGGLTGFALSKGTVRFSAGHPLPEQAVRDLVRHRIAEITGG